MEEQPELELRHYLDVLRRRAQVVVLVVLLAVGATLAISLTSTRIYEATADVLLTDTSGETVFGTGGVASSDSRRRVETQIEVMQTRPIEIAVNRSLGEDASKVREVTVFGVGETDVIQVNVQSPDARIAKRAADLYASTYVETRQRQQVEALLAAGDEVQKKLIELQAELDALPPDPTPERTALATQLELFRQKLDQVQVDAAVKSGGAQVVAQAEVPTSPVKPTPVRDAALALVLGLLLGVGLAFLAEYLDDKVNTAEDVTRFGHGVTVLAEIPAHTGWRDQRDTYVISLDDPHAPQTEAYRSLRTSLQIIGLRRPVQSVLVTSPMAAEGKTTTVVNLGVALARAGRRVVLVDLDLRRPRLARFFDVDDGIGFTSVLVGDVPLADALRDVTVAQGVPPLQVLGSGPIPPNPSELMGATRVTDLLTAVQGMADIVIIDSAPLIPVTDALVLSGRVDGVLLVVGSGTTRRRNLSRAMELLESAEAPVLGAVLNATSAQRRAGRADYGYGGYSYAPEPKGKSS